MASTKFQTNSNKQKFNDLNNFKLFDYPFMRTCFASYRQVLIIDFWNLFVKKFFVIWYVDFAIV